MFLWWWLKNLLDLLKLTQQFVQEFLACLGMKKLIPDVIISIRLWCHDYIFPFFLRVAMMALAKEARVGLVVESLPNSVRFSSTAFAFWVAIC